MDTLTIKGRVENKIYKRFESFWMRQLNSLLRVVNTSWHVKFLEKFGAIREEWVIDNLTTSAGKAQFALLAGDASAVPFTYLAVGTSSTAVAVGQTALGAEITDSGFERAAAIVSRTTTTVTNDTLNLVKTWTATGSKTIEEVGYFNASSSGTLGGRALTTSRTFSTGETYLVTYTVTFS